MEVKLVFDDAKCRWYTVSNVSGEELQTESTIAEVALWLEKLELQNKSGDISLSKEEATALLHSAEQTYGLTHLMSGILNPGAFPELSQVLNSSANIFNFFANKLGIKVAQPARRRSSASFNPSVGDVINSELKKAAYEMGDYSSSTPSEQPAKTVDDRFPVMSEEDLNKEFGVEQKFYGEWS